MQHTGEKRAGIRSVTIKQLKEVRFSADVRAMLSLGTPEPLCTHWMLPMQACEKHTQQHEDIQSHQNVGVPTHTLNSSDSPYSLSAPCTLTAACTQTFA